jgi:hypothetical protein
LGMEFLQDTGIQDKHKESHNIPHLASCVSSPSRIEFLKSTYLHRSPLKKSDKLMISEIFQMGVKNQPKR